MLGMWPEPVKAAAPSPADATSAPRRASSQKMTAAGMAITSSMTAHGLPSEIKELDVRHGKSSEIPPITPIPDSARTNESGKPWRLAGTIREAGAQAKTGFLRPLESPPSSSFAMPSSDASRFCP